MSAGGTPPDLIPSRKDFQHSMDNNEQGKKGLSSCMRTIIIGAGALVLGFGIGFVISGGCSGLSPMGMVRSLESRAASLTPGEDGAILATIEDETITDRKSVV